MPYYTVSFVCLFFLGCFFFFCMYFACLLLVNEKTCKRSEWANYSAFLSVLSLFVHILSIQSGVTMVATVDVGHNSFLHRIRASLTEIVSTLLDLGMLLQMLCSGHHLSSLARHGQFLNFSSLLYMLHLNLLF